jgi:hypothetical protein
MSSTVQVAFIKREDVPCGVALKSLLISPSTIFFIFFPEVIGLRARCEPIVEDLDVRHFCPKPLGEFRNTCVPETPD